MTVRAHLDAWLETDLPRLAPGFLATQRWFAGKARTIRGVAVDDAVWLTGSRRYCVLVVLGVRFASGDADRYLVLLAFVDDPAGRPVVGPLNRPGAPMWAVEAAGDSDAMGAVLRHVADARDVPTVGAGRLCAGDANDRIVRSLVEDWERRTVRTIGAEQSNTSVRIDRSLVVKLFRKLDAGENPEVEIGRFLTTRTSFRAVPALRGSLTYVSPRGERATVAVLQDWIDNHGDGWSHVVSMLRQLPDNRTLETLRRDLFALGATTADLHAALAADASAPAFAPESITATDAKAWQAALLARTSDAIALVERTLTEWPGHTRRLGEVLLDRRGRAAALAGVPSVDTASASFRKIRIHGDYHLGQTLKTDEGFVLIDFEGEPARPLAERRSKHCALKDVAGMIRSLDYARETAGMPDPNESRGVLSAWSLREFFLDGYLSSAIDCGAMFLPPDRRAIDAWIGFFELEKALYELEYEINSRPAWVRLPLRGILRILGETV
jgi:trehalose synthase-fused probable maltokinase